MRAGSRAVKFAMTLMLLAAPAAAPPAVAAPPPTGAAPATPAEVVALVGATLHPVSGPEIANGVILIDGSRITAVGRAGEIAVPPAARVIQCDGKHLYPGFIDPVSQIGLRGIESVRGSTDTAEIGDDNANIRAQIAFDADSVLIGPAVAGGVLYAEVETDGGVVSGSSAVMRLHGWNLEDMTLRAPAGMHVQYPRQTPTRGFFARQSDEEFQKQKEKALKALQDIFDAARAYQTARTAMQAGKAPAIEIDPRLEALRPVLAGKLPLYIHAEEKAQIEGALDWAKREKLTNLVLVAGPDAQYVAARLAKEKVAVILTGVLDLPARRWEPYDAAYAAAGILHKAGVKVAIGAGPDPSQARNLPFHAAMAAAFGIPKEVALRTVTMTAAEILGVADRIGSLEPGKEASFFLADGDPLEIVTHIERVWIGGQEIDLAHERQRELYDRYRNRPKAAAAAMAPTPPAP
jgi:imidazolonepropionase-like amidohydrolase